MSSKFALAFWMVTLLMLSAFTAAAQEESFRIKSEVYPRPDGGQATAFIPEGTIKWEEIFNNITPPAGWQVIDNDGSGAAWDFRQSVIFTSGDTINPQAGQSFWFSNYTNANGSGLIDEWLITPRLPMIEAGDMLHFYAGAIDGSYPDSLKVLVSVSDSLPSSFTEIAYFKVDGPIGAWNQYSFDLSAFAGSEVFVAVNYYIVDGGPSGNNSDNVWVDHFILEGQSTNARLQVIHNAADPAAASVDVYVNGALLLDNFAFRTATPFVDVPAGVTLNIGVAPGNSASVNDTLVNIPVVLAAGETYAAIANGVLNPGSFAPNPDGINTGFQLLVQPAAREAGSGSDVEFYAVHGSTDAPTVDIIARGVGTLLNNVPYTAVSGYLAVPPASYIIDIADSTGSVVVASFEADLSGLGGGAAAVIASGFLNPAANQNGPAFTLIAVLANGTVIELPALTTARLQVIHNAADPAASAVDVYVNGGLLLDDFAFRTASPFIDAPANTALNVGVAPPNSNTTGNGVADTLKNFAVNLLGGGSYVAVANGVVDPSGFSPNPDGRSIAFTLFARDDAREASSSSGEVDFAVLHGSTDAPTVDVVARNVATLVNDAAYGDFTAYLTVPAADYTIDITDASGATIVASYTAPLSGLGGSALVVFASGFLSPAGNQNGPAFGLYAVLPGGGAAIELPPVVVGIEDETAAVVKEFALSQNYPNPFNPSTTISFALPVAENVTVKVFNLLGQEVATVVNERFESGVHRVNFDATNLVSGVYFYRIDAGSFSATRKMILMK